MRPRCTSLTAQLRPIPNGSKRLSFSLTVPVRSRIFHRCGPENYRDHIYPANVAKQLDNRVELTYEQYRDLHNNYAATSETYTTEPTTHAPFRLSGVTEFQRRYEAQ